MLWCVHAQVRHTVVRLCVYTMQILANTEICNASIYEYQVELKAWFSNCGVSPTCRWPLWDLKLSNCPRLSTLQLKGFICDNTIDLLDYVTGIGNEITWACTPCCNPRLIVMQLGFFSDKTAWELRSGACRYEFWGATVSEVAIKPVRSSLRHLTMNRMSELATYGWFSVWRKSPYRNFPCIQQYPNKNNTMQNFSF